MHRRAVCQRVCAVAAGGDRAVQPGPRVGARHDEAVQRLRQLSKLLLRKAGVRRHKVRAAHVIAGVERILHRLLGQHAALLLVADAERRVHAQRLEVLPQQIAAEPVQRGDARAGERQHLLAQLRALARGLFQRAADAQAHLARRRVGERDDEHLLDRAALLHQLHDALHQHRRLARSRRRADDEAVSPVCDGVLLLLRPVRHGRFLLCLAASIIPYAAARGKPLLFAGSNLKFPDFY